MLSVVVGHERDIIDIVTSSDARTLVDVFDERRQTLRPNFAMTGDTYLARTSWPV